MSRPHRMSDGTLVYVKKGWEPPALPEGYRRKSDDLRQPDAWVLVPVLPPCERRTTKEEVGSCGAVKITYHCRGERLYDLSRCGRCHERD